MSIDTHTRPVTASNARARALLNVRGCHSSIELRFVDCLNIRFRGYNTCFKPNGFTNNAAMESANATAKRARSDALHRYETNHSVRRSRKEQNKKTASTINPNGNDPWQLTHKTNSGGRARNHRALRVRARQTMSSSHVSSR